MMSVMMAFVGTAIDTSRANTSSMDTFRAKAAAQSIAGLTIADIWGDFDDLTAGAAQMWAFRTHLDAQGMTDQTGVADPAHKDYLAQLGLAQDEQNRPSIDGIVIERVSVHRLDTWDATSIVVEVDAATSAGAVGSSRERRSSVQETFTVAPPNWNGLDFALLASNINCLLCHTTIDNVERTYNFDTGEFGSFDSVRVGSIDAIHFRSDPDSSVAGVTLIGRDALLGDGQNIADWSAFNLRGGSADAYGQLKKIQQDPFGNTKFETLNLYDQGNPDSTANFFLDFLSYKGSTDYDLPETFPSPFPDNGGFDIALGVPRPDLAGNRIVDDSEFYATVAGVKGTVSGGSISVLTKGTTVTSSSDRTSMANGTDPSLSSITDGNVYLHGTKTHPLILDGDVAIDGDVIISGYVKGMGTIRARGNVYVVADLMYADGGIHDRTYGFSADGTENNLAITAGGNIVVGDYYRPAWGSGSVTTGETTGSFNFTMDELAIFNRMEWMKTQPTLPGETVKVQTGTKTVTWPEKVKEYYTKTVTNYTWVKTGEMREKPIYQWQNVSNGLPGEYEVITRVKVQIGTKLVPVKTKVADGTKTVTKYRWVATGVTLSREDPVYGWQTPQHANPDYNPYHTPRYYSFAEDTTVPVFNKKGHYDPVTGHWMSEERAGDWDSSMLTYADPTNTRDPLLFNADGTPKAVVSQIAPSDNWISPDMMRKTIELQLSKMLGHSKDIEIDATLYSANSILGTIPERNSPHTNGELLVNGGIVASDVGILAPNGTEVNFDVRGARALAIQSDSGLVISRRFSAPAVKY